VTVMNFFLGIHVYGIKSRGGGLLAASEYWVLKR